MTKVRERGEQIRKYVVANIERHPDDIAKLAAQRFGITRQAINKHLKSMADEGILVPVGATRSRTYKLCPLNTWEKTYPIAPGLAEDVVWRNDVMPALGSLPSNAMSIWHYGFSEMFNNAIDHSAGSHIYVHLEKTAVSAQISIHDDGIGIFKKIQTGAGLLDERHAVLELAKGKLTTDPSNHTGEGIFFTSRAVDEFGILSGGTYFSHNRVRNEDWIMERSRFSSGTSVWMKLNNHTSRSLNVVFRSFAVGDDLAFTKTVVPVRLAQYGEDKLISRSQAKRLLERIDRFRAVIFDFQGVDSIGQAFADEIFRVFAQKHPEIELTPIHAIASVEQMIKRAERASLEP